MQFVRSPSDGIKLAGGLETALSYSHLRARLDSGIPPEAFWPIPDTDP